jgi:hypothetical protein
VDVHLGAADACLTLHERLQREVRGALSGLGGAVVELPLQDLSPSCNQGPTRRYLPPEDALRRAEADFPGRRIRPVLFYFNNVDLPLPLPLAEDLRGFREERVRLGRPAPVWLSVAPPSVTGSGIFDTSTPWTFSGDPALLSGILDSARGLLPFVSREAPEGLEQPLLPADAGTVEAFKVCEVDARVVPEGFPTDGTAVTPAAAAPPRFLLSVPRVEAEPHSAHPETPARIVLELCREDCAGTARTEDGRQMPEWRSTRGCLSALPSLPEER